MKNVTGVNRRPKCQVDFYARIRGATAKRPHHFHSSVSFLRQFFSRLSVPNALRHLIYGDFLAELIDFVMIEDAAQSESLGDLTSDAQVGTYMNQCK